MNNREKKLLVGVLVAALGWAAMEWAVTPAMAWYANLAADSQKQTVSIAQSQDLLAQAPHLLLAVNARLGAGLLDHPDALQSKIHHALGEAAETSGFALSAVGAATLTANDRPHGASTDDRPHEASADDERMALRRLKLSLTGHGSLRQTLDFLAKIEQIPLPLRIEHCDIESRDPVNDLVQISLGLSALNTAPGAHTPKKVAAKIKPWKPDAPDAKAQAALAQAIVKTNPLRLTPPQVENCWQLCGISLGNGQPSAWFCPPGSQAVQWVETGKQVGGAKVTAITQTAVQIIPPGGGAPRNLAVGDSFQEKSSDEPSGKSEGVPSKPPAAAPPNNPQADPPQGPEPGKEEENAGKKNRKFRHRRPVALP